MWTVLVRTIRNRRTMLIAYAVANVLLLIMFVGIFPTIQKQVGSYEDLIKAYPESMMKIFNADLSSLSTLEGYIGVEQFSITWPILALFFVVSIAGSTIVGEIEKGTMALLLAQPVSRLKIFFAKYYASIIQLVVFILFSVLVAVPIARLMHQEAPWGHYLTMSLLAFLFGWAAVSIAFVFSAFFSEKGRAYALIGGLFVVMYVVNILATLKENLADLKYASFFYYFNQSDALLRNTISREAVIVFVGVALVCTALAAWRFVHRDMSV